jgi:hypothetical protein
MAEIYFQANSLTSHPIIIMSSRVCATANAAGELCREWGKVGHMYPVSCISNPSTLTKGRNTISGSLA